jgi:hypothetical protein
MRRSLWMLVGLLLLVPLTATAGGGGTIKRLDTVQQMLVGSNTFYIQALQHDVNPLGEANIYGTVTGQGEETQNISFHLSDKYRQDNVFEGNLYLTKPGTWTVTVNANHWVHFPPLTFTVTAVPAGTKLADPAPILPAHVMSRYGYGTPNTVQSDNMSAVSGAPMTTTSGPVTPSSTTVLGSKAVPDWPLIASVAALAALGAGFLLGRRTRA